MKRAVLAFAIAMTAAGVASALGPLPAAPPKIDQPESPRAPAANAPKPLLEARQAPVPLLLKPRATIAAPQFDADAVGTPPPKAGDSVGEGRARSAIEADGYRGVKVVRKGANGLWYAEALRGKDRVLLTVDAQGNVAQE
jgi:hypothetical protein